MDDFGKLAAITAVFMSVIALIGLSSYAERRSEERVRVACIEQGMQVVEDNCVHKSQ